MKKLPLGIQTLKKIHENNCVYIDKTDIALRLIASERRALNVSILIFRVSSR